MVAVPLPFISYLKFPLVAADAVVGNADVEEFIFQIPDSVEEIGGSCFKNFDVLAKMRGRGVVSIGPESKLRNIPDKAFYNDEMFAN